MRIALIAAAALAAALAGCDRPPTPQVGTGAPASGTAPAPGQQDASRVMPAGPPTAAERKESDQPTQGQVDTKEPEQRRDFQERK